MTTQLNILRGVRTELGDLSENFRDSFRGNGLQREWDLSARNIDPASLSVYTVVNSNTVELTGYVLDERQGILRFVNPPAEDLLVLVSGEAHGIFSNEELDTFIHAALYQHLAGRTSTRRYRDGHGFIKYDRETVDLDDLPPGEEILVVLLATIESLWALSTDAAMDIDVQTAEGTSIPRTQRFRQITAQIDLLTDKYQTLSLAMGVGLYAPEVMTMRRVSRATGRLIPIFQSREYDETGPPIRKLPRIAARDSDPDGPASPLYGGWH